MPDLFGTLIQKPPGTLVFVRLMPSPIVLGFMILWSLGIIGGFSQIIAERGPSPVRIIVPLFMLACGYAMVMGGFWHEVPKAKSLLTAAIGGR